MQLVKDTRFQLNSTPDLFGSKCLSSTDYVIIFPVASVTCHFYSSAHPLVRMSLPTSLLACDVPVRLTIQSLWVVTVSAMPARFAVLLG